MLSRKERFFAKNPANYSKDDQKRFRHRIKKKIAIVSSDLEIICSNWKSMGLEQSLISTLYVNNASEEVSSASTKTDKFSKYENNW
ncbi:MAG: hypothetical protein IS860_11565 [Nitrosopumilus sp.]|nr:hypothetical protein [Nitrosopumilus sp.]